MPKEKKLIKLIVSALKEDRRRKRRRRRHRRRSHTSERSSTTKSRTPSPEFDRFDINLDSPSVSPVELEDPDIIETVPSNPYKEALGMDYEEPKKYTGQIHNDIINKFNHILTTGLTKEERETITKKHTVPDNCTLLDAPQLNPEVKAVLTEPSKLRDQGIELSQKQVGLATSIVGKAMTDLITTENIDKYKLLSDLADATKILTSKTKRDTLLYGENLPELLKNAKLMQQAAAQIKKPTPATSGISNRPSTNNQQLPRANGNDPPPKQMKMNARGGPPRTIQSSDQRRPRPNQHNHCFDRTTHPQDR